MKILMIIFSLLFNLTPRGHVDQERCTYVYDEQHSPQEIKLYGKVRIVDIGETFKVRIVDISEDLKVTVKEFSSSCGEWQFVDIGEDFSVRFVDIGEDFTIRFSEQKIF